MMMAVRRSTPFLVVVLGIAMAGCQTVPAGHETYGGSATRTRLSEQTQDYRRTVVEGVQLGAVLGAVGAAAVTGATGGSGRDVARNALIGAVAGGALGGIAGTSVANNKQAYVAREDELAGAIRTARSNNAKLAGLVRTSDALVRERRTQAAALGKASAEERRRLRGQIAADRRAISAAESATAQQISRLESLKSRLSGGSALDEQIRAAKSRRQQLNTSGDTLKGIEERIK